MTADKAFISTAELTKRIKEQTLGLESGKTSLAALDALLDDIRELEERIIVIRYKGMERLRMEDVPVIMSAPIVTVPSPQTPAPDAPPPPSQPVMQAAIKAETAKEEVPVQPHVEEPIVQMEEPSSNQISLIDSIEELSKDIVKDKENKSEKRIEKQESASDVKVEKKAGVNPKEKKKDEHTVNDKKTGLSYAEKMEMRPVGNIKKELNLNQRLGLGRVLAPGDDKGLDRILAEVDEAKDLEHAMGVLKNAAGSRWDSSPELMDELINLVERKFQ